VRLVDFGGSERALGAACALSDGTIGGEVPHLHSVAAAGDDDDGSAAGAFAMTLERLLSAAVGAGLVAADVARKRRSCATACRS
jgi:hypothetical protein